MVSERKGGSSVVVSMGMGKWCFLGGKSYVCVFVSVFLVVWFVLDQLF